MRASARRTGVSLTLMTGLAVSFTGFGQQPAAAQGRPPVTAAGAGSYEASLSGGQFRFYAIGEGPDAKADFWIQDTVRGVTVSVLELQRVSFQPLFGGALQVTISARVLVTDGDGATGIGRGNLYAQVHPSGEQSVWVSVRDSQGEDWHELGGDLSSGQVVIRLPRSP